MRGGFPQLARRRRRGFKRHPPPVFGLLEQQETYVDTLLDEVRKARTNGLSLEEAKRTVHVGAFLRHLLYAFVQTGHVELAWSETAQGDSLVAG